MTGYKRMTQLMQKHANKNQNNKKHPNQPSKKAPMRINRYKKKKEQKGYMNPNGNSKNTSNFKRPFHSAPPQLYRLPLFLMNLKPKRACSKEKNLLLIKTRQKDLNFLTSGSIQKSPQYISYNLPRSSNHQAHFGHQSPPESSSHHRMGLH